MSETSSRRFLNWYGAKRLSEKEIEEMWGEVLEVRRGKFVKQDSYHLVRERANSHQGDSCVLFG